ncbi:matrix metalloproteinase-28 isoform X2 [Pogona vitticeps]
MAPILAGLWLLPPRLLVLQVCAAAAAGSWSKAAAERFLEKYGYFESQHQGSNLAEFSEAIREFQWLSHLPVSGALDASTLHRMRLPRCGVRDTEGHTAWKARTGAPFAGETARRRRKRRYLHQSGALAHAFFPRRGEAHFDDDERWSLGGGKGHNLFVVVAHEIGHTLGLEHSPVRNALMSPYYKKLGKDFILNWDDILAIQNLYGKPARGSVVQLPGKLFSHFQDLSHPLEGAGPHRESNFSSHYCWSFFDAITTDLADNLYIFKGDYYWIISKGVKNNGPHPLRATWPGLPSTIDAAAFSEEDGKFYFFRGGRCWCYKGSSLEMGFPQKCSNRGDLPRHPDTALYFQPLHRLVLFKGPKYYVVNEEALRVEPYYPRSLRDWGGVPAMANGALTRRDGSVYFFRDDRFWKFDSEKLRVIETGKWAPQLQWLGCQDAALNQAVV